jgi:aspartate racemase
MKTIGLVGGMSWESTVPYYQLVNRTVVHRISFEELCLGTVLGASRDEYLRVARGLVERGAEGVILGCTEIGMLLADGDLGVPFFDTTAIHAGAAALLAVDGDGAEKTAP